MNRTTGLKNHTWKVLLPALIMLTPCAAAADDGYVVVVSKATAGAPGWQKVVDTLAANHDGEIIQYDESVGETLDELRRRFPRYVALVATPAEATRQFVADVHRMTRRVDDDPYTDVFWGIVTGYDAAGALRLVQQTDPLVVRRVASGTEVELDVCEQGVWYCELKQHRMVRKQPGEKPEQLRGPADTTKALVDTLNDYKAQLFITSGHATERDWQIGFRYRNGQFRCSDGRLYGLDTQGNRHPIDSPNPKVYLPIGNCLMGHVNGPDAMALAFLNSAGVCQMAGYTVPTWYGYAGWGLLDYFVEQPGRYTLTEAVFANQQALVHRLAAYFPEVTDELLTRRGTPVELSEAAREAGLSAHDARGLLYDRDTLAFYGDPAYCARMAPGPLAWKQSLKEKDDTYTLAIDPQLGRDTFEPVNINGSQRGGRPIVQFLPWRVENIEILKGKDLNPLVTDNFILIPHPGSCDPKRDYNVVFRADRVEH